MEKQQQQQQIVYSFGSNAKGQLANGTCDDVAIPRRIAVDMEDGDHIHSICGGGNHSALLTTSGRLWMCGENEYGQLGVCPDACPHAMRFQELRLSDSVRISQVSCGWTHTCCIDEHGRLWAFGSNQHLQLGGGGERRKCVWTPQLVMPGVRISQVSCGVRHTLAVTVDGDAYAWGSNRHGQCGVADAVELATPTRIASDARFRLVAAGLAHSALVSTDNRLYTVGQNKDGRLGVSGDKTLRTLVHVLLEHGTAPIAQLVVGWHHTALATQDGQVVLFGRNTQGQLGAQNNVQEAHVSLKRALPAGAQVEHIASGSEHFIALISTLTDGQACSAWTWGWNEHGNCGIADHPANVWRPTQVQLRGRVQSVGCGGAHSFVVCSEL